MVVREIVHVVVVMREGTASEDGKEERSNKEDTGFVSRPVCSNSFLLVQIRSVLCDDVELHIYLDHIDANETNIHLYIKVSGYWVPRNTEIGIITSYAEEYQKTRTLRATPGDT